MPAISSARSPSRAATCASAVARASCAARRNRPTSSAWAAACPPSRRRLSRVRHLATEPWASIPVRSSRSDASCSSASRASASLRSAAASTRLCSVRRRSAIAHRRRESAVSSWDRSAAATAPSAVFLAASACSIASAALSARRRADTGSCPGVRSNVSAAEYAAGSKRTREASSAASSVARLRISTSLASTARLRASVSASRSRTMRGRDTRGSSATSRSCGGPTRTMAPGACRFSLTTLNSALSTAILVADTSRVRSPRAIRSPMARFSTVVFPVPGGPHTRCTPSPRHAR
jgi:hypothetical protein